MAHVIDRIERTARDRELDSVETVEEAVSREDWSEVNSGLVRYHMGFITPRTQRLTPHISMYGLYRHPRCLEDLATLLQADFNEPVRTYVMKTLIHVEAPRAVTTLAESQRLQEKMMEGRRGARQG